MDRIEQQLNSWYEQCWISDRLYQNWAQKWGLTSTAMFALTAILQKPEGCTPTYLTEQLSKPKQTIASLISTMTEQGYLIKDVNPLDRRSRTVRLSETGAALAAEICEKLHTIEYRAFEALSEEDRATMTRLNQALIDALKESFAKGESGKDSGR